MSVILLFGPALDFLQAIQVSLQFSTLDADTIRYLVFYCFAILKGNQRWGYHLTAY